MRAHYFFKARHLVKRFVDGMLGEVIIGFLDSNLDQGSHDELGSFDDLLVFKFTG